MKVFNKKMYNSHVGIGDIIDYLKEVEAQVETLEVLNEELERENEELKNELAKFKYLKEEVA